MQPKILYFSITILRTNAAHMDGCYKSVSKRITADSAIHPLMENKPPKLKKKPWKMMVLYFNSISF